MRVVLVFILFCVLTLGGVWNAPAEAQGRCLSRGEQRDHVRSGRVVRPSQARRAARGEVVRIRLCEGARGLEWQLQVLHRDGRVQRLSVDAQSGRPVR